VTEHIEGFSLSEYVSTHGPLDLPGLHAMALGTAAGLAAIHTAELVHRDLKPSNVMLTFGGVRIIDFGIARALDQTTGHTRTGIVMGSLGWAAPEQLEGATPTPAMDVFAWGCVVGYAATGLHPFGPGGLDTRANRILREQADLTGIPDPIRAIVGSALQRDPAARPTAQQILLALVGATPERSPKAGFTGSLFRRHPGAATFAWALPVTAALVMAIGAAAATELGEPDRGTGNHRPSPSSRSLVRQEESGQSGARNPDGSDLYRSGQPGNGGSGGVLPIPEAGASSPVPNVATSQAAGNVATTSPAGATKKTKAPKASKIKTNNGNG
jgi:serine/threonine protein kinase